MPVDRFDTTIPFLMTLTFWRRVSDWRVRPMARTVKSSEECQVRLPLRRQILLPLLAIVALCVVGVSGAHVWLTTRLLRQAVGEQIRSVAKTLNASTFPLETNVLRQVRGLSGAELVVVDPESGLALAASDDAFAAELSSQLPQNPTQDPANASWQEVVTVAGATYFTTTVWLDRRAIGGSEQWLEIYYPESTFRAARWQAIYPSLLVGGTALVLAVVFAGVVAARVTEPVQLLKRQTEQIAAGDFNLVAPPARDDELRDLALAVNRMAQMLSTSASQLREHERAATLHQVGAGIAHQLRNAATGCRMAIDLFKRQQSALRADENLEIATRQLSLMESYLQRFLVLGRPAQQNRELVALHDVVTSAVALVKPLASHLHVTIEHAVGFTDETVCVDRISLEQALVNLLTNAIEACAARPGEASCVRVSGTSAADRHVIAIADNGAGLSDHVSTRLGEPFVTSKPEGTGLGIAVAKENVAQHSGTLRWRRENSWTIFEVELPA